MSLSYTIRESISGFSRARLSTVISIMTISISLLFLGMFMIASIHTAHFIDVLRAKVELEAFLEEGLSGRETGDLTRAVGELRGVASVQYVSKDDAAAIFRSEFGEDIHEILEYNPLPASLKIALSDGHKTATRAKEIAAGLESMKGIESVSYRKELLELIDSRAASINNLTLGLGIIISLSAIFLVSNTIRLTIFSKRHMIRTMELVGATRAFIRFPFLLEGIIQGIIGGLVASALLFSLVEYAMKLVSVEFAGVVHRDPMLYAGLLAAGALLGLIGGLISVSRFIGSATAS